MDDRDTSVSWAGPADVDGRSVLPLPTLPVPVWSPGDVNIRSLVVEVVGVTGDG